MVGSNSAVFDMHVIVRICHRCQGLSWVRGKELGFGEVWWNSTLQEICYEAMLFLSEMFVTHNQYMAEIFLKWTADDGNAPIIFATKTVHICSSSRISTYAGTENVRCLHVTHRDPAKSIWTSSVSETFDMRWCKKFSWENEYHNKNMCSRFLPCIFIFVTNE